MMLVGDEISSDGNPIDFMDWYPTYVLIGNSIQPYKVANAVTEAAKDLLIASMETVAKYNQVNLQFKHVMHKLVIFENGAINGTAASGTDAYPSVTSSRGEFIVAPQTLATGAEMIDIQIAEKAFTYKVPAVLTALESGKKNQLTLSLTRYGSISAWGNQGDISDEIEFNYSE